MDGLNTSEAAARLTEDGPNALPGGQRRTLLNIVWETATSSARHEEGKMAFENTILKTAADFWAFSKAGRALAELHVNYETVPMYSGANIRECILPALDPAISPA